MKRAHRFVAVPDNVTGIAAWDQVGEFRTERLSNGMGSGDGTRLKRGYAEMEPRRWKLRELEASFEVRLRKIRSQLRGARERLRTACIEQKQLALALGG